MGKAKRKTLPKDFEKMLREADFATLTAALEACEPNARGVLGRRALAFKACSDELARWLVARGADVDAPDDYDSTPLQSRISVYGSIDVLLELGADVHRVGGSFGTPLHTAAEKNWRDAVLELLARGAHVDALNKQGKTPLEVALDHATNAGLPQLVEVVRVLLDAGATK
jgi:ankyrin repeat protein